MITPQLKIERVKKRQRVLAICRERYGFDEEFDLKAGPHLSLIVVRPGITDESMYVVKCVAEVIAELEGRESDYQPPGYDVYKTGHPDNPAIR